MKSHQTWQTSVCCVPRFGRSSGHPKHQQVWWLGAVCINPQKLRPVFSCSPTHTPTLSEHRTVSSSPYRAMSVLAGPLTVTPAHLLAASANGGVCDLSPTSSSL